MGISRLSKVIGDYAPDSMKSPQIKNFFGRVIAIDASMFLYQFLTAIRHGFGGAMTNEDGNNTSHLVGMLYRSISLMEKGIKPVYVFDGTPPKCKQFELEKRHLRREEARQKREEAEKIGDTAAVEKMDLRLISVTQDETADVQKLLKLMGIPFVIAPGEAEAQCAALVKANLCYAMASEDMDSLAFGSKILLRHLTAGKKAPLMEIRLSDVLSSLEVTQEQFVEICILLGCDYCPTIRGVGPKKAVELIKKYQSIDRIVENLDKTKYQIPENWAYKEAKKLFMDPTVSEVSSINKFEWSPVAEAELRQFLVEEKGFSEEKLMTCVMRLKKLQSKTSQKRIDSFFASVGIKRKPAVAVSKKTKRKK